MDRPGPSREYRQQIPRPPDAEVVAEPEAVFARLSPLEAATLARVDVIEQAFANDSGVSGGGPVPIESGSRPAAAVLLPLLSGASDEISLVLIRRATHLRSNPGEIAFPGGRLEPGESPLEAALREASEEVALDPGAVRLLGELPYATRATRPEAIGAFVGAVTGAPMLAANPDEVAELFVTPLADLADGARYWEEIWRRPDGLVWRMSFFDLGDDLIWGASARILVSLFDRLVTGGGFSG